MATALTKEEGWGLAISIAGHAALLAVLLLRPASDNVVIPPERVEVTISEDVGMKSMSPDPAAKAAPDEAPDIGEAAPAPEPVPLPPPPAPPVAKPLPKKPEPRKIEAKKPEPRKPPPPKPSPPKPSAIDRIARASPVTAKPATKTPSAKTAPSKAATPPKKPGGTRFAEAFRQGTPGATSPTGTGAPAATIGPQQISALNAAIGRQLKPHWRGKAPEGAEAELLVTKVRFRLNRDGSLAGEPQVVATSGQTEANQPQVARHQEQAVRAVRLAAPFDLPEALYDGWKVVTTNFDRRLSQ
jgi:outer membrane biosynthesis protein TonB